MIKPNYKIIIFFVFFLFAELRKEVLDGTWIGEIARRKSECHSGKTGGELGPFKRGCKLVNNNLYSLVPLFIRG